MRSRICSLVAVIALLLSLTACSNPGPGQTAKRTQTTGMSTIRVALPTHGAEAMAADLLISAFQNARPEYRVEKVELNTDVAEQVRAFLRSTPVDALFVNHNGSEIAQGGLLTDLTPYVSKSRFDLGRVAVGTAEIQMEGKTYGLPFLAAPRVLLANRKLFEAAGVPLPKGEWTWEQFRETAAKLTKPADNQHGLTAASLEFMTQLWLLQANDGQPAWMADADALKGALTLFSAITLTDRSTQPLPRLQWGPLQRNRDDEDFGAGKAAMGLTGLFAGLQEWVRDPIAVLPLPTRPGSKATLLAWYWSMAVPANAPNAEGGWEFVKFASGPEGALVLAKNKFLPAYIDEAVQDAWIQSGALGGEYVVKTHWTGHFGAWSQKDMELSQLMDEIINRVLSGDTALDVALADFSTREQAIKAKK